MSDDYLFSDKQRDCAKFRHKLLKNMTFYEKKVEEFLLELGVDYMCQKGFLQELETFCIADFYIPKPHKLIIEVDGSHHYTSPKQKYKDERRDYIMKRARGIDTLRLSNSEVFTDFKSVENKIKKALKLEC